MFPMKKRLRENDEDETGRSDVDQKKPRTLPFRSSPTAKHTLPYSQNSNHSLTKPRSASNVGLGELEDDDSSPDKPSSTPSLSRSSSEPAICTSAPISPPNDFDMDVVDPRFSPPRPVWEGNGDTVPFNTLLPAMFHLPLSRESQDSRETDHRGRIATPRWGQFPSIDMSMDMSDDPEATLPGFTTTSQLELNHRASLRQRRLPSPIREDGSVISSSTVIAEHLEENSGTVNTQGDNVPTIEQTWRVKIPSSEIGRQKPGKTMLCMGFKADCAKCRARFPGHYNHVIRYGTAGTDSKML